MTWLRGLNRAFSDDVCLKNLRSVFYESGARVAARGSWQGVEVDVVVGGDLEILLLEVFTRCGQFLSFGPAKSLPSSSFRGRIGLPFTL